jgi:uncharacterized membrane protein YagU involved in acid resistance
MRKESRSKEAPIAMGEAMLGMLAGIAGTVAMTVAMRSMFARLPKRERYPLPPREIVNQLLETRGTPDPAEETTARATTLAHFGYGALTGGIFAVACKRPTLMNGAAYGLAVWAASYLGWIPAARLLAPATRHPAERNGLMLIAHLVWGATVSMTLRELRRAERQPFGGNDDRDAVDHTRGSTSQVINIHADEHKGGGE